MELSRALMMLQTDGLSPMAISIMVALVLICVLVGHLLHTNKWVNMAISTLVIGLCAGGVVLATSRGKSSHILQFEEGLFFYYLLPPIIFNAGFCVRKKEFFQNFGPIMLFGVVGVFISTAVVASLCKYLFPILGLPLTYTDALALGVIFSATDSICTLQVLDQDETPLLYSLVFGEGVINDAASIVLFKAIQGNSTSSHVNAMQMLTMVGVFLYLFISSTILGVFVGLVNAYISKKLYMGKHSTDREIVIMVLMPYLAYMLAELLNLSGILAVFFCGIMMSHYTLYNVTKSSKTTSRHIFAALSFITETFIFLYVGMDALNNDKWNLKNVNLLTSIALSATLLLSVILGRASFVFPLSTFSNLVRRSSGTRLSFRHQVIVWWAGLMRGAVSIALAYNQFNALGSTKNPQHATIITSTISVVIFSVVTFGIITKPLVDWLVPHNMRSVPSGGSLQMLFNEDGLEIPLLRPPYISDSLFMLLTAPTSTIRYFWQRFDNAYMRPIFRGREGDVDIERQDSMDG